MRAATAAAAAAAAPGVFKLELRQRAHEEVLLLLELRVVLLGGAATETMRAWVFGCYCFSSYLSILVQTSMRPAVATKARHTRRRGRPSVFLV